MRGAAAATPAPSPTIPAGSSDRATAGGAYADRSGERHGRADVNGLPIDMIVVALDDVKRNVRQTYPRGQTLGRSPRAFSKVGDSTMLWPLFMVNFDWGNYRLGDYAALQRTIDQFRGSFALRGALVVRKGLHSWEVFDPNFADAARCLPGEGPLACELRAEQPELRPHPAGRKRQPDPGAVRAGDARIINTASRPALCRSWAPNPTITRGQRTPSTR